MFSRGATLSKLAQSKACEVERDQMQQSSTGQRKTKELPVTTENRVLEMRSTCI